MKIYFTTSVSHIEPVRDKVDFIFKTLENLGHSVDKFNYSKDPTREQKTDDDMVNAYKHIISSIRNCDYVIAEITQASAAVGFEVALALGEKKPVLVMYDENKIKSLSTPFRGNKSKYLKVKKYKTTRDIETAIKYFSDDVRSLIDTKFILIIPPEIDQYLEWNVKEKGVPKAEVTRDAIERMMREDERYQEFLGGLEVTE